MGAFEYRQAEEIRDAFTRHGVRYLFIGKSGAILSRQGKSRVAEIVQLKNGPFDLDLVFAPDGIERFADAWRRRVEVEGFSVCHIDDIIASKEASGRAKDRDSLPRLRSFREYWLRQHGRS